MNRRARDDDGAAAVEFALILVPMLVIIFGLIQYGLYFYSAQTASNTANSALRQLTVGNCQDSTQLQTYVDDQLAAASTGSANIKVNYLNIDGSAPAAPQAQNVQVGGTVTLTITFETVNMHFPFVPFLSDAKLVREVQARVEDTTDAGCGA